MNVEADRQLVQAIARGSADALGSLYDRHAGVVYALARRMLSRLEDAEEVVQDVFAQVWRDAPRYDAARATVAGWVVMLTRT
ncbi:MAG: sigma factor, partial [Gemmatimonadaceae bacterium]